MKLFQSTPSSNHTLGITRFLMLTILATPLVYWSNLLFYSNNSKLYFFLAVTQLAVVSYGWLAYSDAQWRPRADVLTTVVLAYIGVLLLASLFGGNPSYSFWGSLDRSGSGLAWLHTAAAFVVLVSVFRTKEDWRRVFIVSVCVALIVAAIFLLSLLFPDGPALFSRSKGGSTLGNSSFLGTYLLLQIGMAAYLALTESKRRKGLAIVATAILAVALLLTTAKAAQLSLLGAGVLFVILLRVSHKTSALRRKVGTFLLAILTMLFLVASFLLVKPDSVLHQWFVRESGETRFVLWDIAWQGIKERPLLGWGLENYPDVFQKYFNPCLGSPSCGAEVWFDRAHNNVLDVLVESGVVGLGLFVSLFAIAVLKLWRAVKRDTITPTVFALFASVLAAYFVQGLTVFDTLSSIISWLVIVGFISTIHRHPDERSDEGSPRQILPPFGRQDDKRDRPWLALAIVATMLLPFAFTHFVVAPALGNTAAWDVKTATRLSERVTAYEKAVTVSRQGIDLRRSMLAAQTATFILDLSDKQIATSPTLLQRELQLSEQGLLQTIQTYPTFIRAYLDLGFLYQAWAARFDESRLAQAETILQDAVARFPNNPLSSWALVGVYLDRGKSAEALELARRALDLDPQVRTSQYRYLLTLKLAGRQEEALAMRDELAQTDPAIATTITPYLEKDVSSQGEKMILLFRYYYDAGF